MRGVLTVNDGTDDLVNLAITNTACIRAGESCAQGWKSLFSERLECASSSCWSEGRPRQEARNAAVDPSSVHPEQLVSSAEAVYAPLEHGCRYIRGVQRAESGVCLSKEMRAVAGRACKIEVAH